MRILFCLALCLAVNLGLASVSLASAQDIAQGTTSAAGGCVAQLSGKYGTLEYAQDGSVEETTEGTFKLWLCKGLYFTFDGGPAVEPGKIFNSQAQFDWFASDLNLIVAGFIPVDTEVMGPTPSIFTLPPRKEDLDNRPAHLLLRSVDMAPAGVALRFPGDDTLRFFYFEDITGPSFNTGGLMR